MKYFAVCLLVGLGAVAVLGAFAMHPEMQGHDSDCIASTVQKTDCLNVKDAINSLAFHVDVFKGFSTATLRGSASGLLNLLVLFAIFSLSAYLGVLYIPHLNKARASGAVRVLDDRPARQAFVRWLAFHQNSPTLP